MGREGRKDLLAFGMLTPFVAKVATSKKLVMFSVFTGKTPERYMCQFTTSRRRLHEIIMVDNQKTAYLEA